MWNCYSIFMLHLICYVCSASVLPVFRVPVVPEYVYPQFQRPRAVINNLVPCFVRGLTLAKIAERVR